MRRPSGPCGDQRVLALLRGVGERVFDQRYLSPLIIWPVIQKTQDTPIQHVGPGQLCRGTGQRGHANGYKTERGAACLFSGNYYSVK